MDRCFIAFYFLTNNKVSIIIPPHLAYLCVQTAQHISLCVRIRHISSYLLQFSLKISRIEIPYDIKMFRNICMCMQQYVSAILQKYNFRGKHILVSIKGSTTHNKWICGDDVEVSYLKLKAISFSCEVTNCFYLFVLPKDKLHYSIKIHFDNTNIICQFVNVIMPPMPQHFSSINIW